MGKTGREVRLPHTFVPKSLRSRWCFRVRECVRAWSLKYSPLADEDDWAFCMIRASTDALLFTHGRWGQ